MAERASSGGAAGEQRRMRPDGRPVGKPFAKGHSGNPGGRQKERLRELVSKATGGGKSVVELMDAVHRGQAVGPKGEELVPTVKEMLQAGEWLAEREYGKATQPLEHSGPEGGALVVEVVSYAGGGE